MSAKDPEDVRMSLGDHLEELRKRILWGLAGPLLIALGTLAFGDHILAWLIRPARIALQSRGLSPELISTEFGSTFSLYMRVCFITGLVLGIPWLFYQLWLFVAPGLYKSERKLVERMLPASALLSIAGVTFMYYVLLPMMLFFLVSFTLTLPMPDMTRTWMEDLLLPMPKVVSPTSDTASVKVPILTADPKSHTVGDMWIKVPENELRINLGQAVYHARLTQPTLVTPLPDVRQLFDFTLMLGLAFAVSFQLPLVMLVVGWLGIVNYRQLASIRKYALLGCVCLAAVITPGSDPISLTALTVPLYGLYELGVLLVRWTGKAKTPHVDEGDDDDTQSTESPKN